MSIEVNVTEDVKNLVNSIIKKRNLNPDSDVVYSAGSEIGDGYMSKTVAVDITDKNETLHLFVKYALTVQFDEMTMESIYANEVYFYDVILPTYLKFGKERDVKEAFRNAPKCMGTSPKNALAMENLRKKNFELFDRKKIMNDDHIVSVLNAFAKYHALSFAFKDQHGDVYKELTDGIIDLFTGKEQTSNTADKMRQVIEDFQNHLDPINDKLIRDRCDNVADKIIAYFKKVGELRDEYSVITKGDCWNNNIMFRYEEDDKTKPAEVMLIDWQIISIGSLVIDVSYFFYTVASREKLENLNHYMKLYYEELSKTIRQLGSDPDTIYPYSVFEKEWREHALYGYSMSFRIFNAMLISKEDVVDVEETSRQNKPTTDVFSDVKPPAEYYKRLKDLTEHFVNNNFF